MSSVEETSYKVERLTADNYVAWKFSLKMYLLGKELWDIVDGTRTLPADATEETKRVFKKHDNQALSIVCLAVSKNLHVYVRNAKSAKEAWDNLSNHFEEKTLSKQVYYRKKLYHASLTNGMTMTDHVNNIKTLSEQLEALDDPVSEREIVMILISSLPPAYNNLITALETLKGENLTWNYVRDRVIHEFERKKSNSGGRGGQQQDALLVERNRGGNGGTKPRGGGGPQSAGTWQQGGKTKFKCHYCHEKGHFSRECKKKLADLAKKEEGNSACCEEDITEVSCSLDSLHFEPEIALAIEVIDETENDTTFVDLEAYFQSEFKNDAATEVSPLELYNFEPEIALATEIIEEIEDEATVVDLEAYFQAEFKADVISPPELLDSESDLASIVVINEECEIETTETDLGENSGPEFALAVNGNDDNSWWIDSACSQHMSGVKEDFVGSIQKLVKPVSVKLADKSIVPAAGQGTVHLTLIDCEEKEVPIAFKDVLYVPKLKKKLISVPTLDDRGAEVSFKGGVCTLIAGERKFVFGHKEGKLYKVNTASQSCNFSASSDGNSLTLWHLRLGHLNNQDVKKLSNENMVKGLKVNSKDAPADCEGCLLGKQTRLPFPKKSSGKKAQILDLVHSDVCGPMSVPSVGGSLYFVTLIDDHSNFTWVFMLKQKSAVSGVFLEWLIMVETLTEKRLKEFRSDNGGEYVSNYFSEICKERGISLQPTIPYTPQQNGVAERMNRTIMDNVRATLYHAKLPLFLWAEAVATVVYVRNVCPTSSFKGVTPHERFFSVKPDVGHLRVFGCTAFVHVPDEKRRKLDAKSVKGIFVGYPSGSKGYKVYVPETRKMIKSRDVKFLENSFPTSSNADPSDYNELVKSKQDSVADTEYSLLPGTDEFEDPLYDESEVDRMIPILDMSRPLRNRRSPQRFGEWATVADVEIESDPKTYKQAMKSPNSKQWENAMKEELSSLNKHNTWDLVDLPAGKNLVGCKWVFKTKRDANGAVDRFKARLVAQGYSQEYGIDYDEVFAPVARYDSIRSVLAIGVQHDYEIHQMDVKSAFLNGELDEEIFMKQPEGYIDENHPEKVCRLNSSLYGLKQSARCWNLVIDSYLKSKNFVQNLADPCIYYKSEIVDGKKVIALIAVYVDDSIICSNELSVLNAEKKDLSEHFEMDDRGEIHYILGMSISRDRANHLLTIDQKGYLQNVLIRFGMENCKPVSTPVDPDAKFISLSKDEKPVDVSLYQAVIGSLNYAAICTRPDLSTAVGILSKFMQNPGNEHWVGVKRVLRYVQGTLDYGLVYHHSPEFHLKAYADSDWAGCVETRKSTSGHVCCLGSNTISWRSKKQPIVALSSTEAEYIALCAATQEVVWMRRLLKGVAHEQLGATVVYEDNQGAMSLSRNSKDHARTKHIDVKYHYVREAVEKEIINVKYVPTADMLADALTKGLARPKFEKFRNEMGVMDVSHVC